MSEHKESKSGFKSSTKHRKKEDEHKFFCEEITHKLFLPLNSKCFRITLHALTNFSSFNDTFTYD